jgi:N-acetyl-anhydromuramyl-L-alanine amidase AmpD
MARAKTDLIIVHCSATKPSQDINAKTIDRWHRARGWLKIGYHFVIKRDGTVEKGRELMEPGAHAKGYNANSVGVCLVGGLAEDGKADCNFTKEQWQSLATLVEELSEQFPAARIIGHREVNSHKECPCFDVTAWYHDTFH